MNEARFVAPHHLRVGDIDFHCRYDGSGLAEPPAGFLPVSKTPEQVARYLKLCAQLRPRVIVEVGVQKGGSTALLHALNLPSLLVALELTAEPPPALSAYIQAHGLSTVIKPHYGVDQADRDAVSSIMHAELGGRRIDLAIDDASHLLEQTRSSFETLFPLLRAGGVFVIEDWNADHLMADHLQAVLDDRSHPQHASLANRLGEHARLHPQPERKLVRLPLELVLARASAHDVIREVTVMDNWVVVVRGDEPLPPGPFRLADLVTDHFANLREPT